jgi:hypothetical protein
LASRHGKSGPGTRKRNCIAVSHCAFNAIRANISARNIAAIFISNANCAGKPIRANIRANINAAIRANINAAIRANIRTNINAAIRTNFVANARHNGCAKANCKRKHSCRFHTQPHVCHDCNASNSAKHATSNSTAKHNTCGSASRAARGNSS